MAITLQDIRQARERIQDVVQPSTLGFSRSASERLGTQVFLKFENQQITGSFKIRGALNKMRQLSAADLKRGVVAASAGNHAQGVAYSARKVGAQAHIVMPVTSPLVKVMATQGYGAQVIQHGVIYDESYQHALELAKNKQMTFIHPYEDAQIIAGQGTIGLEILELQPDIDSIVIPIGGGGLISGVATAMRALRPSCKIYGVVSAAAPGMRQLFKHEAPNVPTQARTIADGISVKKPSELMYRDYIAKLVDDVIEVNDDEIAEAIVFFLERAKAVVEGSGATVFAGAVKAGWPLGAKTCLLLSGGNIDLNILSKVIERGLSQKGRLARVNVVVPDRPGALQKLTNALAERGANILDVKHDRLRHDLQISETAIEFLVESRSFEHLQELHEALQSVRLTT